MPGFQVPATLILMFLATLAALAPARGEDDLALFEECSRELDRERDFIGPLCAMPDSIARRLMGDWRVVAVDFSAIAVIAADEARAFIGRNVSIRPGRIESPMQGRFALCERPFFSAARLNRDRYFAVGFRGPPAGILGFAEQSLILIAVACQYGNSPPDDFAAFLIRPDGRLVTHWDGVFYVLERTGS